MVMDQALRPEACRLATRLRFNGQSVDVVLEQRKMKQVFKVGCGGSGKGLPCLLLPHLEHM